MILDPDNVLEELELAVCSTCYSEGLPICHSLGRECPVSTVKSWLKSQDEFDVEFEEEGEDDDLI